MAKHGLPIYPIYDEMPIQSGVTLQELEWMIEHGMIDNTRSIGNLSLLPKSPVGLPLTHQVIAKRKDEYVKDDDEYIFIMYDQEYRGDDPAPGHYVLRRYLTLEKLLFGGADLITGSILLGILALVRLEARLIWLP